MKVTNYSMINIMNILNAYSSKKLPQKISYAITRNLISISDEYSYYENALKKIFEKYNADIIRDTDGNIQYYESGVPVVNDNVKDKYNNEIEELLQIEIDINMYYISRDSFDYSDESGIYDAMSARDIITLESILCDNESNLK